MAHRFIAGAGPVDADDDLLLEPDRDLPENCDQHLLVMSERVRVSVAGPEEHGQALAGIGERGAQRMEARGLLQMGAQDCGTRCGSLKGSLPTEKNGSPARVKCN